jgi:4-hydroxybenzoate polyprenyltransferase
MQPLIGKTRIFLEMIKFEHSIFALPFAYLGLFLAAGGWPRADTLLWITLAMVSFRTMAMAANRLIDREVDRLNPRTTGRALPQGLLSGRFVWISAGAAWAVFEWSAWALHPLCFRLSPVPVAMAWLYPWLKRFTWFSHLVLGMILGIAPYGAWIAVRGSFSWVPGLFFMGITAWVAGFDIIYALQDVDYDRRAGLHSFPARFGQKASLRAAYTLHVLALGCWLAAGFMAGLGAVYFAGLGLAAAFLAREQWLVRNGGLAKLNEAFFIMNAVTSVAVFLAAALDLMIGGAAA